MVRHDSGARQACLWHPRPGERGAPRKTAGATRRKAGAEREELVLETTSAARHFWCAPEVLAEAALAVQGRTKPHVTPHLIRAKASGSSSGLTPELSRAAKRLRLE